MVKNFSKMGVSGLSALIVGFCLFLGFLNISEGHERGCISKVTSWLPELNIDIY